MSNTDTPANEQTFEQQVNVVVDQFVRSEDGKLILPEDLEVSEPLRYAAVAEKRRRDTQAEYTKSQQKLKQMEATVEGISKNWEADALATLSAKEAERLEELKFTDPDKWRVELANLEAKVKADFNTRKTTVVNESAKSTELERRQAVLDTYNAANPDHAITDQVLADEVPPKFMRQLEAGEISFDEFIVKCGTFLKAGKVIAPGAKPKSEPDLSELGGGSTPDVDAVAQASASSYKNEIY